MLSLIVAMDENNLIGKGNELPWYYKEDLKYFKKVTLYKAVLMGYNTYLSIVDRLGTVLPHRANYVLTYEENLDHGAVVVTNLEELIDAYKEGELFVIGGKMVYETMLDRVDRMYITRIPGTHEGNVYFPTINYVEFKLIGTTKENDLVFEIWDRIKK